MNDAQQRLYRREWGLVRRVLRARLSPKDADAERHAIHGRALGADKSSREFTNDDLDEVLKAFRAISQPANFKTQIELEDQPAKRGRFAVRQLAAALGDGDEQIELRIAKRHHAGRLVTVHGDAAVTLDTLGPADLDRIKLDLKQECRRRWPRKGHLLTEIRLLRMEQDFDEAAAQAAVRDALRVAIVPPLEKLDYDKLLMVIAALRGLAKVDAPF